MLVSDTLAIPMLWMHRNHLDRSLLRTVPPFTPASLVTLVLGLIVGAALLGHVSPASGRLALAVVIVVFVGFQAVRSRLTRPAAPRWWSGPAGAALAAGTADGWLSTGGVVLAMFLTARRLVPERFVVALVAYFLVTDSLRAVTYAVFGYWTPAVVALYLGAVPIALAGYVAGLLLRRLLPSERLFRTAILIFLTLYALALIARALGALAPLTGPGAST